MHTRLLHHIRHNVVAYLALFVALGGTSYAVVNLPANSVGSRQLRNHAITPVKLDPKSIAGTVRAWLDIEADQSGAAAGASSSAVKVATTGTGETVKWVHQRFGANCVVSVTPHISALGPAGLVTVQFQPREGYLVIRGFSPTGDVRPQAVYALVICP